MYVSKLTYIHLETIDTLKIKCSLSERLVNSIDMEKYAMVVLI